MPEEITQALKINKYLNRLYKKKIHYTYIRMGSGLSLGSSSKATRDRRYASSLINPTFERDRLYLFGVDARGEGGIYAFDS